MKKEEYQLVPTRDETDTRNEKQATASTHEKANDNDQKRYNQNKKNLNQKQGDSNKNVILSFFKENPKPLTKKGKMFHFLDW